MRTLHAVEKHPTRRGQKKADVVRRLQYVL